MAQGVLSGWSQASRSMPCINVPRARTPITTINQPSAAVAILCWHPLSGANSITDWTTKENASQRKRNTARSPADCCLRRLATTPVEGLCSRLGVPSRPEGSPVVVGGEWCGGRATARTTRLSHMGVRTRWSFRVPCLWIIQRRRATTVAFEGRSLDVSYHRFIGISAEDTSASTNQRVCESP